MPIDVDYLVAERAIEKIKNLLGDIEHGAREKITNDILDFALKMEEKYGQEKNIQNE